MRNLFHSGVCAGILCLIFSGSLSAQNITEKNWFFGDGQHNLVFDKSGRDVVLEEDQSEPFGLGGPSVINNQFTGDLLFYTDGNRIYDADHNLLPGIFADRLSANTDKNQAVATCPVPGNLDQYYIFTNSDTAINVSTVDASLPGLSTSARFPLGEMVGTINNPMGLANPSEGMIVLESGDGLSYWLITQDRSTYVIHITNIAAGGVFTTKDTTLFDTSIPGFEVNHFGHYAYNNDSIDVAFAPKNANRNVLVTNFNTTTGTFTIKNSYRNTGGSDEIYDVEWSADGQKLYYSVLGNTTNAGGIYQIDLADTVNTDPYTTYGPIGGSTVHRSYGLRRGIDQRIYHLYQETSSTDPYTLARIDFADQLATLVVYDDPLFEEDFNGRQFPSFAPPYLPVFDKVDFDFLGTCQGNTTQFFPDVNPEPNNYFWIFSDGYGTVGSAPLREMQAGTYDVTLVAELNGRFGTAMKSITITPIDTAYLGMDTTICQGEGYALDPGISDPLASYVWNTGDTTRTLMVDDDTTRNYWVNVTLSNGCTTYDDIAVTVYLSQPQPPSSQWYFGEQAAIDFSSGNGQALFDDNIMYSPEGCASISDVEGNLLFYTNGSTVWNKEHEVMQNGTLIGGDSSAAQSALIIPFADDDTFFYIFTTEEVYGDDTYQLKYSIVDIKQDTARGAVVKKGVRLVDRSSERVASSGFDSPILLTHEFGNNNYRVYSIQANGISAATHSSIGEPHRKEIEDNHSGYMKFSPQVTDIAVLIPGDSNFVEILDFNFFNGAIQNPRLIDLEESGGAKAYGLEYSTDGGKLYVSLDGTPSKILQYDLDSLNTANAAADIESTKTPIQNSGVSGYGALQMGPDGVIYLAIENSTSVGSITAPDADVPTFQEDALTINDGNGQMSRKGLPNFIQDGGSGSQASALVSAACVGHETFFSGAGYDPNQHVEVFAWDFGDGVQIGGLTSPDTTHVYTAPIDTIATLYIEGCGLFGNPFYDTLYVPVVANLIPEVPQIPSDTALCGGQVTLTLWDQDDPSLTYYWSSGDSTRTVTFTQTGVIDAAIIDPATGCSSDTLTVFIGDGSSILDLGEDLILCQNDPTVTLDASSSNSTYEWRRDSIVIGTDAMQDVRTSIAGTFMYYGSITNTFTGCVATDSVEVTILPEPDLEQGPVVQPDCSEANGSIIVQFNETGNYSYELAGDTATYGPFNFDGPGATPSIGNLGSGSYILTATNNVTGCQNVEVFLLEDDAPFEMEANSDNGCFRSGDIRVILRNFAGTRVDISVLDSNGDSVYIEENRTASNIRIEDLDTGIYYVSARQVIDPQCLQTDTVRLQAELSCFREIAAPNAFSPNGNGMNEEFFVFPNEYINKFEIYIYNRWGQIVFNSKDANFRWDGTFQNKPAPPETYAYKMIFTSTLEPGIGEIVQYGSITLIR
ncbi:MAG: gliding motility-associated C-terminal domain-containing protein [Cyclobacteriaceae bacterium]